jgi:DNA invertase Pin-like site-specific DNA recombinase
MSDYIYKPPASLKPGSLVIAYCRDSGGQNQEQSIGQQERAITAFCEEHKLTLGKVYSDTGSGRKTKNRSQFLEMFNDVMTMQKELLPAGLLLWAYSRFSRDTVDFNYYLSGLQMKGLTIHSLTEEIPEGMAGQIMLSVKSYTNADYSIQLGKAIKRGIADRVKAGYCNGGQAPKGYTVVKDQIGLKRNGTERSGVKWEVDPQLGPLVRLAFELRAQGKGYGAIIKATDGRVYKNAGSWLTCFRNKSYLGIGKAGDLEIPDHHEPLITWELFEAVKKVSRVMPRHGVRGNPIHPRRMSNPSLLSGIAFCVYCGAAMVLHTSKDYRSYLCGKRDRQKGYKDCTESRNVNARKADRTVIDTILNQILTPSFVEDLLAEIQNQMADINKIDREIFDTNNLVILAERSITRLLQLAENTGEIDEIGARMKILKQEKDVHIEKIKYLKTERAAEMLTITPEALDLVFSIWRAQIEKAIKTNEILTAKKLLTQFVSKIELSKESAIIYYKYPVSIPAEDNYQLSAHLFFGLFRQVTHSISVSME